MDRDEQKMSVIPAGGFSVISFPGYSRLRRSFTQLLRYLSELKCPATQASYCVTTN